MLLPGVLDKANPGRQLASLGFIAVGIFIAFRIYFPSKKD